MKMSNLMTVDILKFEGLNLAKVGRAIKLIYDKQPVQLKTGILYLPFGISKYKKQWSQYEEYSIDCYIQDDNKNIDVKFTELNNKIFELVKENAQLFSNTDVSTLSNSPFYRDNKSYPKLLKLQLPRDSNGNFTTQFFDENGTIIHVDENNIDEILAKKTTFKTLITCSKVWVYQNKVGSIWNIVQIKLNPKQTNDSESETSIDGSDDSKNDKNSKLYTQNMLIDDE